LILGCPSSKLKYPSLKCPMLPFRQLNSHFEAYMN
jgi:hypothetical protein